MAAVATILVVSGGLGLLGSSQVILILDEQCDKSISYFPAALDNLDLDYTTTADEEEFGAALSEGGPWDVIIVDEYRSRLGSETVSALRSHVVGGGRLYMNYWEWSEDLAALFQVRLMSESAYYAPVPIHVWEASSPLFTVPNVLVMLTPAADTCYCDGAKFTSVEDGMEVAGYTTSWAEGEAAVVIGNGGRTILFGGIVGLFSGDEDSDGREDGLEFAENVVSYLVGPVSPSVVAWIPYVRMTPEYDNVVAVLGFRPAETRTTDPAELASLLIDEAVLLIPEQQEASEAALEDLGRANASALSDFLSRGGRIVGMSYAKGADDILRGAGLWNVTDGYDVTWSTLAVAVPEDPLARGVPAVPAEYEGPDGSTDFQGLPEGAVVVVWDPFDEAPVVFRWETLGGTVIMLGFDYYEYNCATSTVLCNAVGVAVPRELRCSEGTPLPCPICDGKVYTYGTWRVQVTKDDLYIVAGSGALGFRFWGSSNGWFDVVDGGEGYTAWSSGTVTPGGTAEMPIQSMLTATPAGPVPEELFTFGAWDVMFSTQGVTLQNSDDIGVDGYKGVTLNRTDATAVFTGRTKTTHFPQFPDGQDGCPRLCEDISVAELEDILDEMGFSYEREEIDGTPVWFVSMAPGAVAIYPFSQTATDRYAGLQFMFVAFDTPVEEDDVDQWNQERRGSRAYIDDDGDAVLEGELYLEGGVPRGVIISHISRFESFVQFFLEFLSK